MFKFNYNQIFQLAFSKALVKYRNNDWFREKLIVWTVPPVARDSLCLLFVISFCFVKHSSSHFVVLYVIISISIYYYWVRFQQLKYSEPLHGKLQTVFDLSFDIRYLSAFVPRSTLFLGFFAYICTIGVYLFYAAKSILLITGDLKLPISWVQASTNLDGIGSKIAASLWIDSIQKSSAGFFPLSMTVLSPLQCLMDPSQYQTKLGITQNSFNFGKYLSLAYNFDNKGLAPFFGHFTTDLEILKVLEHFSFQKFSLFQFFSFTFQTAFRVWIPLFSGGYKNFLVWWVHPLSEGAFINILSQSRYIFEPYILAVSLVLENSIQQIYASFYMDRWVLPFCTSLNQLTFGTKLSQFVHFSLGYVLKYAPIYIRGEQVRLQTTQKIVEILFSPFILGFQLLVFTSCCLQNVLNSLLSQVDLLSASWVWLNLNPALVFNPF